MRVDISLHGSRNVRTAHFFPDNANSVCLDGGAQGKATFYDLPYEKALALALLFADAHTKLYFLGDVSKLLLENQESLAAMRANDSLREEAEAREKAVVSYD